MLLLCDIWSSYFVFLTGFSVIIRKKREDISREKRFLLAELYDPVHVHQVVEVGGTGRAHTVDPIVVSPGQCLHTIDSAEEVVVLDDVIQGEVAGNAGYAGTIE